MVSGFSPTVQIRPGGAYKGGGALWNTEFLSGLQIVFQFHHVKGRGDSRWEEDGFLYLAARERGRRTPLNDSFDVKGWETGGGKSALSGDVRNK